MRHISVDAAQELCLQRYLNLVAFAILYYDYGLTASQEYERYWFTGTFTWTALLFFVMRYISVFGHVPVIAHIFLDDEGPLCSAMLLYHQILAMLIQLLVGILLVVRTYALYNRNRWVLFGTLTVGLSGIGVAAWAILFPHGQSTIRTPGSGCDMSLSQVQGTYFAIAWGAMLVFDALIFALTVCRAFVHSRKARGSLFGIMLRDGSIYFGCMAGANLGNIITFIICSPGLKGVPTILTNVLSTTLISRLMLNIRDPKVLERTRSLTTQTSTYNAAGHLSQVDNLPFYSTLFRLTGDVSAPLTQFSQHTRRSELPTPAVTDYYELRPVVIRVAQGYS
ncbi:hypothetical protein BXZ70DRAFT_932266, partial [Cristinia sonorae]